MLSQIDQYRGSTENFGKEFVFWATNNDTAA